MSQVPTRKAFWGAVALQVAVVLSGAAHKYWQRSRGRQVKVRTLAKDPRSMFRGDYVVLRYAFSRVRSPSELPLAPGSGPLVRGDRAWLQLEEGTDGTARATLISDRPFATGLQLQGRVETLKRDPHEVEVTLDFGIDAWFVPEGTGQQLEARARAGDLVAVLSVLPDGRALLVGVE